MVGKSTTTGQAPTFALVLERFEHNLLHLLDSIHRHTLADDLTNEQKVDMALQVAEGLHHLHCQAPRRLVHGDIKPK